MSRLNRGNHFLGGFGSNNFLEDYYMDRNFRRNPVTNISENENRYKVEMGIPGFQKKDLEIYVKDGNLFITGSRKKTNSEKEVEQKKDEYWQHEFDVRTFEKSFRLPDNVNMEDIAAKCEHGMLMVTLPKKQTSHATPSMVHIN